MADVQLALDAGARIRAALIAAAGGVDPRPSYIAEGLEALDQIARLMAELVEERNHAAAAAVQARTAWHEQPVPTVTEVGPERAVHVTWPDGRPEWTPVTPAVIESMAHEITALRTAAWLRRLPRWRAARWRVSARG